MSSIGLALNMSGVRVRRPQRAGRCRTTRKLTAVLLSLAGMGQGCRHEAHKSAAQPAPARPVTITIHPTSLPATQETWVTHAIPVVPQPAMPVKVGAAPLYYLVETASQLRIADATNGKDLGQFMAPGRTIVAIDEAVGVRVGDQTVLRGPLPANHRYAIYLESTEENVVRTGTIRSGSLLPATRPARAP